VDDGMEMLQPTPLNDPVENHCATAPEEANMTETAGTPHTSTSNNNNKETRKRKRGKYSIVLVKSDFDVIDDEDEDEEAERRGEEKIDSMAQMYSAKEYYEIREEDKRCLICMTFGISNKKLGIEGRFRLHPDHKPTTSDFYNEMERRVLLSSRRLKLTKRERSMNDSKIIHWLLKHPPLDKAFIIEKLKEYAPTVTTPLPPEPEPEPTPEPVPSPARKKVKTSKSSDQSSNGLVNLLQPKSSATKSPSSSILPPASLQPPTPTHNILKETNITNKFRAKQFWEDHGKDMRVLIAMSIGPDDISEDTELGISQGDTSQTKTNTSGQSTGTPGAPIDINNNADESAVQPSSAVAAASTNCTVGTKPKSTNESETNEGRENEASSSLSSQHDGVTQRLSGSIATLDRNHEHVNESDKNRSTTVEQNSQRDDQPQPNQHFVDWDWKPEKGMPLDSIPHTMPWWNKYYSVRPRVKELKQELKRRCNVALRTKLAVADFNHAQVFHWLTRNPPIHQEDIVFVKEQVDIYRRSLEKPSLKAVEPRKPHIKKVLDHIRLFHSIFKDQDTIGGYISLLKEKSKATEKVSGAESSSVSAPTGALYFWDLMLDVYIDTDFEPRSVRDVNIHPRFSKSSKLAFDSRLALPTSSGLERFYNDCATELLGAIDIWRRAVFRGEHGSFERPVYDLSSVKRRYCKDNERSRRYAYFGDELSPFTYYLWYFLEEHDLMKYFVSDEIRLVNWNPNGNEGDSCEQTQTTSTGSVVLPIPEDLESTETIAETYHKAVLFYVSMAEKVTNMEAMLETSMSTERKEKISTRLKCMTAELNDAKKKVQHATQVMTQSPQVR